MAGILFQRLVDYCASSVGHMHPRPAALLADSSSAAFVRLNQLGLLAENFQGRLTNCDPALYPVLVVAGADSTWQEAQVQLSNLVSYVENGGKLLLQRPSLAFWSVAQPILFPGLDRTAGDLGLVLRRNEPRAATWMSNHDLYWIEQAGDWNKPELLSSNIAHAFYHKHFDLTNYSTIQVASMPIHSVGGPSAGGWLLWANGYVAQDIYAAQAGTYLFNISASGTPALGGWPHLVLQIDGRTEDLATVTTTNLTFYSLSAELSRGTHRLSLAFDNDAYAPPEDRNLLLAQVRWGQTQADDPIHLLTRPGAVAQVGLGKGVVVLDEVAWENESRNAPKAGRYATQLLTGLGAAFQVPSGFSIQAASMTNVNVNAFSTSAGTAFLNSNGRIETTVRFTATGSYIFQVVAGGTAAQGVLPQIAITIDGVARTNFFLSSTAMVNYAIILSIPAGTHKVGLAFLNDFYAPPEDRNAAFSSLAISPVAAPRIVSVSTDPVQRSATIQWEGTQGKAYQVQVASNLLQGFYPAVNVTNQGSVGSWQDLGGTWGSAPLSSGASTRYYRLQ